MRKRLKRFTCHACGQGELVTGGSRPFFCSDCKEYRLEYNPYVRQSVLNGREAAMAAVAKAIRSGGLAHPSELECADCGATATEYDHRDYNQPLNVDPVCRRCNLNRGPAIPVPYFMSRLLRRGEAPYRLNKRVRQLFDAIGADTRALDDMPPLLGVSEWLRLMPLVVAAMPELEPDYEASHA